MKIIIKATVTLILSLFIALTAFSINSPFFKKSPRHQQALNQLKLINDCAGIVMKRIKNELIDNGSIIAVTPATNMNNMISAGKMCHGIIENISNNDKGVMIIEINNMAPVIPPLRNDQYVFTPLDQDSNPINISSTDISEWICTSYTAGNLNSNAANFKAYGATSISLLTSDPTAMPILALCI